MTDSLSSSESLLKIIMVGDSGVGKSCLLKCFMGEPFEQAHNNTIGVDLEMKPMTINDKTINLQIWDTAGQERFRTITTSYYRSSDAIMLVFDVSEQQSFVNCETWLQDIRLYAKEKVEIMLLGNKADLLTQRVVEYKTAKEFADKYNMMYMETSAKQDLNVEKAFTKLAVAAFNRRLTSNEPVSHNTITPSVSTPKSSKCSC
eukprot:TRINITY_DN7601_c0_g1_i1.p1 TRINITY_DN7601_c0_g1~~TRINITY_DN7601_c0_g1_i1.p1  ORF type:complete len:220 (+),score=11.68 TRINITY_DN7601_c0_g1_i1:53-661(+)